MQGHFWQLFLRHFWILFHMVPLVLLSMVALKTIFWLVEILQQPIRIFQFTGFLSYHGEKKERYHVKEHKKLCFNFVKVHHSEKQTVIRPVARNRKKSRSGTQIFPKDRALAVFYIEIKDEIYCNLRKKSFSRRKLICDKSKWRIPRRILIWLENISYLTLYNVCPIDSLIIDHVTFFSDWAVDSTECRAMS